MNKLLFIAILLVVSFLSYVVYAVTQSDNEGKSANEIIASLMNSDVEEVAVEQVMIEQVATLKTPGNASEAKVSVLRQQDSVSNARERSLESFAEKSPLKISIRPMRDEQTALVREVELTFTNVSDRPVKILKPLDGSYYGWYQPHYKFKVLNSEDEELKLSGRCGNSGLWAETTFPESYLIELPPEETHKVSGYLPFMVPETGQHKISFEYIYNYKENDAASPKSQGDFAWSRAVDGVWQGTARSNTITVELKKND